MNDKLSLIKQLYKNTESYAGKSVAAAAAVVAAAHSAENVLQRAVFAHTVSKCGKDGPAASSERAGREYVSARPENEQDDENPKVVVAAGTAIHNISSLSLSPLADACGNDCRRVCNLFVLRSSVIFYV